MTRRYQYSRMEPGDLSADMTELGLSVDDFAKISGAQVKRVANWLRDPSDPRFEDIPPWVPVLCAIMKLPGGVERARETAAFYMEAA